jgi:hypothetical protein
VILSVLIGFNGIWLGHAIAQSKPASADVAGNWKWTIDPQGGQTIDQSVKFKQDGQKLSGTFTDGFDGAAFDIKDGKLSDGQVSFTVVRPFMDAGSITLNFSGKLEGETIKGKVNFSFGDQPMSMDWNAKRAKDDDKPATRPAAP